MGKREGVERVIDSGGKRGFVCMIISGGGEEEMDGDEGRGGR